MKGQTLSIIQGKETDTEVLKSLKKSVLTTGEFEAKDLINYTKAGKAFKNHLRIKPFRGGDGNIMSFVGILSVDEYLPDKRNVKVNKRITQHLKPAAEANAEEAQAQAEEAQAADVLDKRHINFNNRIGVILIPARR